MSTFRTSVESTVNSPTKVEEAATVKLEPMDPEVLVSVADFLNDVALVHRGSIGRPGQVKLDAASTVLLDLFEILQPPR